MLEKTSVVTISNASHRPLPYFEWFYFHFVTDNGAALNLILHETDIFGLKMKRYLSLSVLLPGEEPCYMHRDLDGVVIAREQPFLQAGDGLISESDRAVRFDIRFPGRGYFRGEITKLAPPLMIKDGFLYEDPRTGGSSHWIVQIPHATFTGILQLDGLSHRLRGTAYQDHQWGTILIQEFISDWIWGHFSNEQVAVVFFQILTQNGQLIDRVAMVNDEGRFSGVAIETSFLDTLFLTNRPEEFSAKIGISFLNQCMQLDFSVSPAGLMRSRIGEEQGHNSASYLRWSATGTIQGGCGSQPLHGISEYIRIHPAMYGSLPKSKHR